MRDMLNSEVGNFYGVPNYPDAPELALEAGEKLAQMVLEPLVSAFGHISIRSAYRPSVLNGYCHKLYTEGVADAWCTCNEENAAYHIWDRRDEKGYLGAAATIVIPAYLAHFEKSGEWRPLGWWMRDNLEHYASVQFFPALCAFNIPKDGNVLMDLPNKWPGYTHAALIVDNLGQLINWLQKKGIPITEGPSVFGHGRRRVCFIHDPDGNVIEFDEILA